MSWILSSRKYPVCPWKNELQVGLRRALPNDVYERFPKRLLLIVDSILGT